MLQSRFREELRHLKESSLYRELAPVRLTGPTEGYLGNRKVRLFCTNNYLGLTHHPKVIEAAVKATRDMGSGAGASRLISGNFSGYAELEEDLACYKGTERALVFSSGYAANLGVVTALAGRSNAVFCDRLVHASLIDAGVLSRAEMKRFRHNNPVHLESLLQAQVKKSGSIVTEGVFSMDGDLAPLPELSELAKRYQLPLVVDDAHGTGVMGPQGRGSAAYFGLDGVDIHIGTLSKAIGSLGGFVAGPADFIDYLINRARSFIYTTALPPAAIAAAGASLQLIQNEPSLLESLWANIRFMRSMLSSGGLDLMDSQAAIMPVLVGDTGKAQRISRRLLEEHNVFIPAIRPPTVPKGQARLRLTVSAVHSRSELEEAALAVIKLCREEEI